MEKTEWLKSQNGMLTSAESEVAELLLLGHTRKQIAEARSVTLSCVNFHIQNIFQKTDCKTINLFLVKYRSSMTENKE